MRKERAGQGERRIDGSQIEVRSEVGDHRRERAIPVIAFAAPMFPDANEDRPDDTISRSTVLNPNPYKCLQKPHAS
jgi:hypothetical protein